MRFINLSKTTPDMEGLEKLIISYEDEEGNIRDDVHFVHRDIKEYVQAILEENLLLEMKVNYWRGMMGIHVDSGVGAN